MTSPDVPLEEFYVSRCPLSSRKQTSGLASHAVNFCSLIWLLRGHKDDVSFPDMRLCLGKGGPSLLLVSWGSGLVCFFVCVLQTTNKLCPKRKILCVLPSSKLKGQPINKEQFSILILVGNLHI